MFIVRKAKDIPVTKKFFNGKVHAKMQFRLDNLQYYRVGQEEAEKNTYFCSKIMSLIQLW